MLSISLCSLCWVTGFTVPSIYMHIVYIDHIYSPYYCLLFPKPPFFLPNSLLSLVISLLFFLDTDFKCLSYFSSALTPKKKPTEGRKDFFLFTVWTHSPPWQRSHSSVRYLSSLVPLFPQSESKRCQIFPNCTLLQCPVSLAVLTNI